MLTERAFAFHARCTWARRGHPCPRGRTFENLAKSRGRPPFEKAVGRPGGSCVHSWRARCYTRRHASAHTWRGAAGRASEIWPSPEGAPMSTQGRWGGDWGDRACPWAPRSFYHLASPAPSVWRGRTGRWGGRSPSGLGLFSEGATRLLGHSRALPRAIALTCAHPSAPHVSPKGLSPRALPRATHFFTRAAGRPAEFAWRPPDARPVERGYTGRACALGT